MKVIFLKNNPSGKKNEVKEVAQGYALNYLLPNKIAILATPERMQALSKKAQQSEKQSQNIDIENKKLINTIKKLKLEFTAKANEEGHLFGGISNEDISKILKEKHNLEINKESINMPHHLKEVGEHVVDIKIKDQETKLKVIIKTEK